MVNLDPQMETAKDHVGDLADDLVYDGPLTNADAFFICNLLHEYYSAEANDERGSKNAVDFAWDLARQITQEVDENPDFDWVNAYFVGRSAYDAIQTDCLEYEFTSTREGVENPAHFEGFELSEDDGNTARTLGECANELIDLTELYVDFDGTSEAFFEKPRDLSMFFRHLGKRYAGGFHFEAIECAAGMQLSQTLIEYEKNDNYSKYDLLTGVRYLNDWLEYRAKELHHTLRTTGTID